MLKSVLIAVLALAGVMTYAGESRPCIDIFVKAGDTLTPGKAPAQGICVNNKWAKDETTKMRTIITQGILLESDDWEEYEFSFTPNQDGYVCMVIHGSNGGENQNNPGWVCVGEVKVTGSEVVNGNFEEVGVDGKPQGWKLEGKCQYVDKDGKKYIKVGSSGDHASQSIKVTAGQEVTVKAKVKKGE